MTATKRCPYCAEEVLEEAKKCKHCGEFLVKGKNFESEQTVTVQMRAKRWKKLYLIGMLVFFAGAIVVAFVWKVLGLVIMGMGLTMIGASHLAAWWYHG